MADMYDEMDLGEGDDMMGEEPDMMNEGDEEIDAEFAMHASDAGFSSPEKQKALKAAIERCVALKEEGEYEEPMAEEEGMGDLGALADMG